MKQVVLGMVMVLGTAGVLAQNLNNGETLSQFVMSETFARMSTEQLQPIQKKVDQHMHRCVAATAAQLRTKPKAEGVSAGQLQRHYQLWQPYYKSACVLYAADQQGDAAEQKRSQLRCELFAMSTFYSEVLGYQTQPVAACQSFEY